MLTISYGSYAMDQRSGDGWFSGWIKIFAFYQRNSRTRLLSCSTREMLQHWTKSSRISASRKRSVWRKWKLLIYEYFRVTGANDSGEIDADLFTVVLRNDDIQEFDSKWDEILLSMTQIPSDDILEGLYKLRIRESEKLKTVLELYNMEIHQNKAGPDHRLKTMVKEVSSRIYEWRIFEARNGNYETNAVVKNHRSKRAWTKKSGRLLAVESQRAVFKRRQLQFPARYQ